MIRHDYRGFGAVPSGPQLVLSDGTTPGPSSTLFTSHTDSKFTLADGQNKHTTYPMVTGSSVLGLKYRDGVLLAADTLGAYGTTRRYKSVERLRTVGDSCVIGGGGEMSDFIYINTLLEELTTTDFVHDDGHTLSPSEVHAYLSRVLYNRRNKMDPLWNTLIVGGVQKDGSPYLGLVSMIGVTFEGSILASGLGNHLAVPLMRAEQRDDMSEEEAVKLLEKCMRVLYYRDRQALNKMQIAKVTAQGAEVSQPYSLVTYWGYEHYSNPSKHMEGCW